MRRIILTLISVLILMLFFQSSYAQKLPKGKGSFQSTEKRMSTKVEGKFKTSEWIPYSTKFIFDTSTKIVKMISPSKELVNNCKHFEIKPMKGADHLYKYIFYEKGKVFFSFTYNTMEKKFDGVIVQVPGAMIQYN